MEVKLNPDGTIKPQDTGTNNALSTNGCPPPVVADVTLRPNTEPKLKLDRPINDQYPYVSDEEFKKANCFVHVQRPNSLAGPIVTA